jgi:hypothetical protein
LVNLVSDVKERIQSLRKNIKGLVYHWTFKESKIQI